MCLAFASTCHAGLDDLYLPRVYSDANGNDLPYRLHVPDQYDGQEAYPLILFLHGAGERGTDNFQQVFVGVNLILATMLDQPAYDAFLLVPQCPSDKGWASYSETPTVPMRLTMEVIDQLDEEFKIDVNRLYITGFSLGAYGTWDAASRYPGKFAAAVPLAGGGDPSKASALVGTPIWAFHCEGDSIVPVEETRSMIDAIRAAGGDPLYTEYPDGGHQVWGRAYNESQLYTWMFSQVVPEPATLSLLAVGALALIRRSSKQNSLCCEVRL